MIAFFGTMAAFASLCAICALVARHTRLPAALAPLPVCCGAMVWLVLGGYLGLLLPAAVVLFAAGGAALLFLLLSARRGGFRKLLAPGFVLFCVAGTAIIALMAYRRPVAQGWDEFSLWATAVKLTREHHAIYSTVPFAWPWQATQKAGLPTFGYFFNFFGAYAAWRIYAAYAVLYASVWSAVLGVLSWRHWKLLVPAALTAFLLPYFTVYQRDIYCNFIYLDSYADVLMGVLCCGALAWYYHAAALRRQSAQSPLFCGVPGLPLRARALVACGENPGAAARIPLWPLALMTAGITLCKDTGMPLALIVAGVAFADLLFANGDATPWKPRVWLPKTGMFALWAAGALGTFVASSKFIATLGVAQGAVANTKSGAEISPVTMLLEGTRLLLGFAPGEIGAQYAEKFGLIRDEMVSTFLPGPLHQVTMVGCGLYVLVLVWVLVLCSALLCEDTLHRRGAVLYGVFSTLGFFAYYAFIGYTYVFVFKGSGVEAITDYNRYITTYYLLWVGAAFVLLVLAAAKGSRWRISFGWLGVTGLVATACAACVWFLNAQAQSAAGGEGTAAPPVRLLVVILCTLLGMALALVLLRRRLRRWQDCLPAFVLVFSLLFFARFNQLVQAQLCVIDYPDVVYDTPLRTQARAATVKEMLVPGDVVYYVNTPDDGFNWFRNSYEFIPYTLLYSHGGGDFADVSRLDNPPLPGKIRHRSLAEFAAELSQCDYVFIDETRESFWQSYGALFEDGGAAAQSGKTLLYRVQNNGTPQYTPVLPNEVYDPKTELDSNGNVLPGEPGQPRETPRRKLVNAETALRLVPVEMEVPSV